MKSNQLWQLFKKAVYNKDPLQFNLYSLLSAVENVENETTKSNDKNDIEENSLTH